MNNQTLAEFLKNIAVKPDILGRRHYQNASVFVPFIKIEGAYHVLFEKRANQIRQGGEISFPGGMIDMHKGETPVEAAIRETKEELGIKDNQLQVYIQFHTLVAAHGIILETFVGELLCLPDEFSINTNEVEDVLLVPVDFFLKTQPAEYKLKITISPFDTDENDNKITLFPAAELNLPKYYQQSWSRNYASVNVYQYNAEIIWGMTAQIMYELLPYLKNFFKD
jgi:8-oxo-dGTP pyrophosphatase MutT (NUDIX family)